LDGQLPENSLAKDWSTHEWLRFLRKIKGSSAENLVKLDAQYRLTASTNAEIAAQWFVNTLSLEGGYTAPQGMDLLASVKAFLVKVGRRKFLSPIYAAMLEGQRQEQALKIYREARSNYHAVARESLDEMLGYQE